MNAHLLRHAVENIWCNPAQDHQRIYRLARMTSSYGVRGVVKALYDRISLPTATDRYMVYQIGQAIPKNIGMPDTRNQWISLLDLGNDHLLHTDLYVDSGITFPRVESYIYITDRRNVIVATRVNSRILDLSNKTLYFRIYLNSYFHSVRSAGDRRLLMKGKRFTSSSEIVTFQNQIATDISTYGGYPLYFVNGRIVHNISPVTAEVGDVAEMILDASVKKQLTFSVSDLLTFQSSLDARQKYILHHEEDDSDMIDYKDDIDLYMIDRDTDNPSRYMGIYMHHNSLDWMRMLTHRDYSLPVGHVSHYVSSHPTDPRHELNAVKWKEDKWTTSETKDIIMVIRHSGYERPLVPTANRITHLYKLTHEQILQAMRGPHATLPLWRAASLEESAYTRFMSATGETVHPYGLNQPDVTSEQKQISQNLVGDAYGYHAAAKVLADIPSRVFEEDGLAFAELKPEHWENATVFEYDVDGVLLEWHYHPIGQYYIPRNSQTDLVESYSGEGGSLTSTTYGADPVTLETGYGWRVYVRPISGSEFSGPWVDITDASDRSTYGFLDTSVTPNRWVWSINASNYLGLVKQDMKFVVQEINLLKSDGHLRFSVNVDEDRADGDGLNEYVMDVPPGHLDVWLNGHALVEGIDYELKWPEVVVRTKAHHVSGNIQQVTYRAHGFCKNDLTLIGNDHGGFVSYNVLSVNDTYDIISNKVIRVIINGHVHHPDDIVLDEDNNELIIEGEPNGSPYMIQTPSVTFKSVFTDDLKARLEDDERDAGVRQYMTEKLPKRARETPDTIADLYPVISPFVNKLLKDLVTEDFDVTLIEGTSYSDQDARGWLSAYEWLLPYDPAHTGFDAEHVSIHPHWEDAPVAVNVYKYNFLQTAIRLMLTHQVNLSPFVTIE